ncbi:hypothetical protein IC229_07555 [Spirosoma sp. BT702]|uniref:Uncharacterized protein n=1 Tax=Spirosoma profusum TaxID=2771354 RepID=A0A927AS00_9BACT|nr:hypothetical protein [Spirosoma profusum]
MYADFLPSLNPNAYVGLNTFRTAVLFNPASSAAGRSGCGDTGILRRAIF